MSGNPYTRRRITALVAILEGKIRHYGAFAEPVRLIVYYGRAILYNTPYFGVKVREFRDVAELAARAVQGQTRFERIYLLNALTPGLQAFEIFPALVECR